MPNGCFGQNLQNRFKKEKRNIIIKFYIFWIVEVPNLSLNWQFWLNLPKKTHINQRHWIIRIQISLVSKFQLKLITLIFWFKFTLKQHFWLKTEKVNITTESGIFKLVYVPNSLQTILNLGSDLTILNALLQFFHWNGRGSFTLS